MCFAYFRICLKKTSFVGTCIGISEFLHIDIYVNAYIFFKKNLFRDLPREL